MSSEIAIKVEGLGKYYEIYDRPRDRLFQMLARGRKQFFHEFWALRNVSFEVMRGETVGIIGRNGSGKSTLLQLICGTLHPSLGDVMVNGRVAALLELGAGFNPEFSGRENVYLNGLLLGLSREEMAARFDAIAAFADIGEHLDQPVKTYSSGMYLRLAFAVAAHIEPDVLIVDEALAVGDIRFQNKCLRKLNEFRETGAAVLFVSHSPNVVEAFCDRVIWLDKGVMKAQGDPARLIRDYVNFMVHGHDLQKEVASDLRSQAVEPDCRNNDDGSGAWGWTPIDGRHNARHGGGAVIQRVRVRFADESGAVQVTSAVQPVRVEAEIFFHDAIPQPLVAIGILNDLNEPVVHFNSSNIKKLLPPVSGNQLVRIEVEFTLPALRAGEYLLAIGIDDGVPGANKMLCHVYDAWAFRVSSSGELGDQGGYIQTPDAELHMLVIRDQTL
jgi:lipopolysaccharide transport system ATP-binding protein